MNQIPALANLPFRNRPRDRVAPPITTHVRTSFGMIYAPLLQRHIDDGHFSSCHGCPVGIALNEATGSQEPFAITMRSNGPFWGVRCLSATLYLPGLRERDYRLGRELQGWIERFESRIPGLVRPGVLQILERRIELIHEESPATTIAQGDRQCS